MMLSKIFCENWRKLHFLVQSTEPLTVTEVHPNSHRLPQPDDSRMAAKGIEGSATEKVKQLVLLQIRPGKA